MAKFTAHYKDNCNDNSIGTFKTLEEAVETCVRRVDVTHSSECKMAREALSTRGYYCMGYSEREVYITEDK